MESGIRRVPPGSLAENRRKRLKLGMKAEALVAVGHPAASARMVDVAKNENIKKCVFRCESPVKPSLYVCLNKVYQTNLVKKTLHLYFLQIYVNFVEEN